MAKHYTSEMERINKKRRKRKQAQYSFAMDAWRRFKRSPTAVFGLCLIIFLILVGIFANVIAPYPYDLNDYTAINQPPSLEHLFGTDSVGRDMFSRCVYGTRYSLPIGLLTTAMMAVAGGFLGLIAAYFGGAVDNIIMRIMDVFQSIPATLLAIFVVAMLNAGMFQILIAITISGIPGAAKTVRAAIFTVRNSEYVEACKSIGSSDFRLMFKHLLPNAVGYMIIFFVACISNGILCVSTLSYIGLGVPAPAPEWGSLLAAGKNYMMISPNLVLFPGLMISITVLGFNLFADGLRDALDPRLK